MSQEVVGSKLWGQSQVPEELVKHPNVLFISLVELDAHHVPPFRSKEYFFSKERQDWMKRFE
jgi:hypothetical protein